MSLEWEHIINAIVLFLGACVRGQSGIELRLLTSFEQMFKHKLISKPDFST